MDQHDDTSPEPPAHDAVPDPRAARDRHRARQGTSAGLEYLRALTREEDQWMQRMVAGVASRYRVDADDLLQEVRLSLIRSRSVDAGRSEVRAWLRRLAGWRAADLRRRAGRPVEPLDEHTSEPPAPTRTGPDADWDADRLRRLGLSRDEAQTLLLTLWGLDLSLRGFADMAERSYPKVRQDRHRGLRKIDARLGLTVDERAAVRAEREHGGVAAAAAALGIGERELRRRLRQAEITIERSLAGDGGTGPEPARHEGGSDES